MGSVSKSSVPLPATLSGVHSFIYTGTYPWVSITVSLGELRNRSVKYDGEKGTIKDTLIFEVGFAHIDLHAHYDIYYELAGEKITQEFINGVLEYVVKPEMCSLLDTLQLTPQVTNLPDEDRENYMDQVGCATARVYSDIQLKADMDSEKAPQLGLCVEDMIFLIFGHDVFYQGLPYLRNLKHHG